MSLDVNQAISEPVKGRYGWIGEEALIETRYQNRCLLEIQLLSNQKGIEVVLSVSWFLLSGLAYYQNRYALKIAH